MAPILPASHPPKTMMYQGTTRVPSLKTALSHAPLTFASCMFCPVGKDSYMTLHFTMMPISMISTSQGGGITLQMLVLPPQMCFLSLIKACGTICLNGGMATISKKFLLLFIFSLMLSFVISPYDAKELFNLCHMSACNVIEWIFGILKWHFQILHNPSEYNMAI